MEEFRGEVARSWAGREATGRRAEGAVAECWREWLGGRGGGGRSGVPYKGKIMGSGLSMTWLGIPVANRRSSLSSSSCSPWPAGRLLPSLLRTRDLYFRI